MARKSARPDDLKPPSRWETVEAEHDANGNRLGIRRDPRTAFRFNGDPAFVAAALLIAPKADPIELAEKVFDRYEAACRDWVSRTELLDRALAEVDASWKVWRNLADAVVTAIEAEETAEFGPIRLAALAATRNINTPSRAVDFDALEIVARDAEAEAARLKAARRALARRGPRWTLASVFANQLRDLLTAYGVRVTITTNTTGDGGGGAFVDFVREAARIASGEPITEARAYLAAKAALNN